MLISVLKGRRLLPSTPSGMGRLWTWFKIDVKGKMVNLGQRVVCNVLIMGFRFNDLKLDLE